MAEVLNKMNERQILSFGEKSEEYPCGYGYCQCGCGKQAPALSDGAYLHFIVKHSPNKLKHIRKTNSKEQRVLKIIGQQRLERGREKAERKSLYLEHGKEKWCRKHDKCLACGTVYEPHWAKGYCQTCYSKYVIRKTGYFDRSNKQIYETFLRDVRTKISAKQKIQRHLPVKICQMLNKNLLYSLYYKQQMSLSDVAKKFNCSRVYILKLCYQYGIKVKPKRQARMQSYSAEKLKRVVIDDNFFETWSNKMAYTLGFIYADGYITQNLYTLNIAQKEIEILVKIKKLMKAEQKITKASKQDIYYLTINSTKIVRDLLELGVTPRKSLTIKFPNVPDEYLRHFIRGVFDGDGTISSGRFKIVSGSKEFVNELKQRLIAMLSVEPKRVQLYEDSKGRKNPSYTVTISAILVLQRLYHLFYENISQDEYLERKKETFERFLKSKSISA